MQQTYEQSQTDVIAFLSSPAAYPSHPQQVDRHETHGAIVFVAGPDAYKIKRAVRFSYMDFSTLDLRHKAVQREVEINRRFAPDLYLGVVPITRAANGALQIGGSGAAVEWALHMRRFEQSALLSTMVSGRALTPQLAARLADSVRLAHDSVPIVTRLDADVRIGETAKRVADELSASGPGVFCGQERAFLDRAMCQIDRARDCLRRRGEHGFVRHCHGDLHLNNIVLWQGMPTPFDALEFDDELATIDTLYDLAFLLMDLMHRQERTLANVVLNRYLWRAEPSLEIEGLVALSLFLGLRAGVRAMVCAQCANQQTPDARGGDIENARTYLAEALDALTPAAPRLIAVGGFSGTGKSTLAASLAPKLNPAPGALHVRSDLERKAMQGAAELERLPEQSYTMEANARVYNRIFEKARVALLAGHSVIVDAVFSKREERDAIEAVARAAGVTFDGLWLRAPPEILLRRIALRTHDASDATVEVVDRQMRGETGPISWIEIEAGGSRDVTRSAALAVIFGSLVGLGGK